MQLLFRKKKENLIMKKTLVALGILTTLLIGTQSSFAACPCRQTACPCPIAAPCATPCACPVVSPACPCTAAPCCSSFATGYAAPCGCNSCSNNRCKEKCSWWKIFQNKNCCTKCNKCDDNCNKCNKCDDCCD